MIDPRKVATLGIGYGALAVATLGFLSSDEVPVDPQRPVYSASAPRLERLQETVENDEALLISLLL